MSLRWRAELRLDLRMRGCHAHLLGPGWSRQSDASASGGGSGAAALAAALSALRLADVDTLPATARLRVSDEYVLHLLLEDEGSIGPGRRRAGVLAQRARASFDQALGPGERRILLLPLGAGRRWLASAIEAGDLAAWQDALQQAGVRLAGVEPALHEEWRRLRGQIRDEDAVLVLLRDEGATLMRLVQGVAVDLAWERFDTGDAGTLERRIRAFARSPHGTRRRPGWAQTDGAGHADPAPVIYMLPESGTLCRYVGDREDSRFRTLALPSTIEVDPDEPPPSAS
ncbi:MAG: hypothetical protein RL456_2462 [Pseudomonadota bacterium]